MGRRAFSGDVCPECATTLAGVQPKYLWENHHYVGPFLICPTCSATWRWFGDSEWGNWFEDFKR